MAKMTRKFIDAGFLHYVLLYPRITRADNEQARQAKKKMTTAAQQMLNNKTSTMKLELDLAANYRPGDLVLTLTYDDEHLPFRRSQCISALKYFRQKLAEEYRRHGATMVMHWNTEHRHGEARWHHHAVMNAADVDYQRILELWGRGGIKFERLKIGTHPDPKCPGKTKDYSYGGLAAYMTKERPDKPSQRCWSYTLTAKHPTVETETVDVDTTLNPPKGAQLLERSSDRNRFGRYERIKFQDTNQTRRTTAKRRKKK